MAGYTDDQIKSMVEESDGNEFEDRFTRLKFLISIEGEWFMTAPALATAYYEEARLCWYNGAFVATIIMAQLALEELIRSHYRQAGFDMKLHSGKSVDAASFAELIDQALSDEYITEEEGKNMHEIRKYRNPYVHIKDAKIKGKKQDLESANFITQGLKIYSPELFEISVEDEAKAVLQIMIKLFQNICGRTGGL